jgi:hypothetical protein
MGKNTSVKEDPQTSFEETVVRDTGLEGLLEKYQVAKAAANEAIKARDTAKEAAEKRVQQLELPAGEHRCGRHKIRIVVVDREEAQVAFTRGAKHETQIKFGLFND